MPRDPPCPLFGVCGGCSLQELSYDEQILAKKRSAERLFNRSVIVHPSPKEFYYRSKVEFKIEGSKVGFRSKNKTLVGVHECLLIPERANDALRLFSQEFLSIKPFRGDFLKYLTLRSTASGELMFVLTTSPPSPDEIPVIDDFLSSFPAESRYWLVRDQPGDDASGSVFRVYGSDHITESLLGRNFIIRPQTFFQSNPLLASRAFEVIKDHVFGRVLDLYSGVGVISIVVSDSADSVVGVEEVSESVLAAKENASLNNVSNVSFVNDRSDAFLRANKGLFDTVVVDPPRAGLGLQVSRSLALMKPKRIVYLSCNPLSLKRDLYLLKEYSLSSLEVFDFFPQTDHYETLAILDRNE